MDEGQTKVDGTSKRRDATREEKQEAWCEALQLCRYKCHTMIKGIDGQQSADAALKTVQAAVMYLKLTASVNFTGSDTAEALAKI